MIETQATRYSKAELAEFEELINEKLKESKEELKRLKEDLRRSDEHGTDSTSGGIRSMDDGIESAEKEELMQSAARVQKYVSHLEKAMVRIKNGTYGVCVKSGKLISKERLRLVPHTQHSIEAKLNRP